MFFCVVALVGCRDCDLTNCDKGSCEEKVCKCEEGYVGDNCELQAKPNAIRITRIEIENLPDAPFESRIWDDDTSTASAYLPDVVLQVRLETSQDLLFTSTERYSNTNERSFIFKENMNFSIKHQYVEMRFTIADLDVPKPTPIYAIIVPGYYSPINGFPEWVEGEDENGATYKVFLEYEH